LHTWENETPRLQEIVEWNHLANILREENIEAVLDIAMTWEAASTHLVDFFDQTRYQLLIESAMKERAGLARFDGERHSHNVSKFRTLDKCF